MDDILIKPGVVVSGIGVWKVRRIFGLKGNFCMNTVALLTK